MRKPTNLRSHAVLLVLLMLANSSFALEIITHGGHDHPQTPQMMEQQDDMLTASHAHHDPASTTAQPHDNHASDEDCVCDEICCASSTGFTSHGGDSFDLNPLNQVQLHLDLYKSISLDLIVPPPNV